MSIDALGEYHLKAVIAFCDGIRAGLVLWQSGALDDDLHDIGGDPYDLGLVRIDDPTVPDHGLWVWEGEYKVVLHHTIDGDDYDTEAVGTVRELTPNEYASVKRQCNPFTLWTE